MIQVELFGPVVIGDIEIEPTIAIEVCGDRGIGPAGLGHTDGLGHVLEGAVTISPVQVVSPSVLSEFKAVVHDVGGLQVPQIKLLVEVPGDQEVQNPIAVVVEPVRPIGVDPALEPRASCHIQECAVAEVAKQLALAPLVDQHVIPTVVVKVAPHRAHRATGACPVQVGQSRTCGDLAKAPIPQIAVQGIRLIRRAGDAVEVQHAIGIVVANRHRSTGGRDLRSDYIDLGVNARWAVLKVDSDGPRDLLEVQSPDRFHTSADARITLPTVPTVAKQ